MNLKKFIHSLAFAKNGFKVFVKKEQNIKVQLIVGVLVLFLALFLSLSFYHFLIIVFLVFLIPGLEMLNGIIEEIANLLKLPYEKTTYLRDLSAALVLWFSLMAAIIGIIIFSKYI